MPYPAIAAFRPLRRTIAATAAIAAVAASLPARADELAAAAGGLSPLSIVAHTPAWAWVVLLGLIWLGLGRMRDREVGLRGLALFPLLLVGLSLYNLLSTGTPVAALAGASIGGLVGAAAGLYLERRYPPVPLGGGRLRLRGEWTSLAIVLTVFIVRYASAVTGAVEPALAHGDAFVLVTAGISGCLAVMLLTRTAIRLRLAFASPIAA